MLVWIIVMLTVLVGVSPSPPPRQCPEGYYEIPASGKDVLKCLPYVSPPDPREVLGDGQGIDEVQVPVLARAMPDEAVPDSVIHITSILGDRRGPLVQLVWGSQIAQFTPNEARAHALRILEAAEAAEQDAFLIEWAREHLPEERKEKAPGILFAFREWRAARGGPS